MAALDEILTATRAYAKRLYRVLSRLGVLSGTGIQLDRQFHAAVRLYRCDQVNERVRNYRQSDMVVGPWGQAAGNSRSRPSRLETEAPALSRWLSSGHKSLLLLAPFGAGKSVVLETFAQHLSEDLLNASRRTGTPSPLFVPLPVRLRAWKWHEDEPFETFLFRSQAVLDESDDGLLAPQVFRHLLHTGDILLLLDGLDELPGGFDSRDGASPRERAMAEVRRLVLQERSIRCVVASRPGYGVDADTLFARDDRLTISEYTEAEIRTYIDSRFAAIDEKATRRAAVQAFARAEPDIKEILSRPLFLAAWCDRVSQSPTSDPHTLTDIMRGLVASAIDPARMKHAIGLPTEQARLFENEAVTQHAILQRILTLGALLTAFASRGFGEAMWLGDVVKQTHALVPEITAEEVERVIFICTQAGFVTLLENGEAFAIKVPVVEFLVGQFLASETNRDRCGSFLYTFRRWVWLPELHDCLFFAMEAIRGGASDKAWIAQDCCQWLLNVSAGGTGAETFTLLADDLLRPFIVLAARLGADLESAAINLVQHRFLADTYYENVAVPILSGLRGPFVVPYVQELLRAAGADESQTRRVQETLRVAGPRVVGEQVPDFVQAVAQYPLSDDQIEFRCEIAIEDAVSRLPEGAIEGLVNQWFSELSSATAGSLSHTTIRHCAETWPRSSLIIETVGSPV